MRASLRKWFGSRQAKVSEVPAGAENPFSDASLALAYAKKTESDLLHQYFERVEMCRLAGETQSKQVLVAGCGPGFYLSLLDGKCAALHALDGSETMVALAKERSSTPDQVIHADLRDPLPYQHAAFDLILCPLTLHYINDWQPTMQEFCRILQPGGKLVFSTLNPAIPTGPESHYHKTEAITAFDDGFKKVVTKYRRPFSAMCAALTDTDFQIEQVTEPLPEHPELLRDKEAMAALSKHALFIFFAASKK